MRHSKKMVKSHATTVQDYLDELPGDRREIISKLRDVILLNLPEGFCETMNWGMITYEVPLSRYPHTYNAQPLNYISLAAQKAYNSLYLMCVYQSSPIEQWLKDEFKKAGKTLNMGKSCLRFRTLEDLPLEIIAQVVSSTSVEDFIKTYELNRHK